MNAESISKSKTIVITIISMLLINIGLTSLIKAQINLEKIKTIHFIKATGNDSLFCVSSEENKDLRLYRTILFVEKNGDGLKLIKQYHFVDAYTVKYLIDDFNGDNENEVLTIDMDETYFSINIYSFTHFGKDFKIDRSFTKSNLYIPTTEIPNTSFNVYQLITDEKQNKILRFFSATSKDIIKKTDILYDKKKKRYVCR